MTGSIFSIEVESYKSFDAPVRLDIAPLTIVLGRNNAGKSALVRAPALLASGLVSGAPSGVRLNTRGANFGASVEGVAFGGRLSGFSLTLCVDDVRYHVAVEHADDAPDGRLRRVELSDGGTTRVWDTPAWDEVSPVLAAQPALAGFGNLTWLTDQRHVAPVPASARLPEVLAPDGSDALLWFNTGRWGGLGTDELRRWAGDHLQIDVELKRSNGSVECMVRPRGLDVRLPPSQVGAGVQQILPVLIALFCPPPASNRSLVVLEHPELHLHPGVHGDVGELLANFALTPGGPRLLVETHSDALLLRVRALIAEQKLPAERVAVYFVDRQAGLDGAAGLRRIPLDHLGTPAWWPAGVFAEPTAEYRRIRRAIGDQL